MSNAYELENTPAVINFSGGRTSAYMAAKILEYYGDYMPDDVIIAFCNTGKEHLATLDFVRDFQDNFEVDIKWLEYFYNGDAAGGVKDPKHTYRVVDHESASRNGEPFESLIRHRIMPSVSQRICTSELKIKTIERFARRELGWKEYTSILGIRYDEPGRIHKTLMQECKVDYPLYYANASVRDVNEYWEKSSFDLAIPNHLGNCDMCFLKNERKLVKIAKDYPEVIEWWKRMEDMRKRIITSRQGYSDTAHFFNPKLPYEKIELIAQTHIGLFEDLDMGDDIDCFCGD